MIPLCEVVAILVVLFSGIVKVASSTSAFLLQTYPSHYAVTVMADK
jgi:hypothetical protein